MVDLVKVTNLKKSYGSKEAVKGISFSIKENEILGLLGPNGSGKTTTIGMILGLLKPSHGEILIDGINIEKNRIEISFNEDLSKDFLKIISSKLFDWTGERWIITLSKKQGELTKKQIKVKNKKDILENAKKTKTYKKIKEIFDDAELVDVKNEEIND